MAKVSIAQLDKALPCADTANLKVHGGAGRMVLGRPADPIHLHVYDMPAGSRTVFEPADGDRIAYVWDGSISVGGTVLEAGSSVIVEQQAGCELVGHGGPARVIIFGAAASTGSGRTGGAVHLLHTDAVPRYAGGNGVGGALHADGGCRTCTAWLHENRFPTMAAASPDHAEAGIHCHSENEVIFVVEGQMRLGARLFGPGTAVAVAAGAMYGFTPGPDGLRFLNFRAEQPRDTVFKNGNVLDEVGYWRDRVAAPEYVSLPG